MACELYSIHHQLATASLGIGEAGVPSKPQEGVPGTPTHSKNHPGLGGAA